MKKILIIVVFVLLIILGIFLIYRGSSKKTFVAEEPAVSDVVVAPANNNENNQAPVKMPNPATVNCLNLKGTSVMEKRGDGGEYGLCYFEDNKACEEWALLNGDCSKGGVKTTGFNTIDQKYCAWMGGKTTAVPNSICILKDGSKCSTESFYNGTCPIYSKGK